MALSAFELQKSVYAALQASASLQALIGNPCRVYSDVPHQTPFPYLTIGLMQEDDFSSSETQLSEINFDLHAWSRTASNKEARDILSVVHDILHDQTLALSGYTLVNLRHQSTLVFKDDDAETMHGVSSYRAVTQA